MKRPILFYISYGHGTGADKGAASGKFVELELNKKVADALQEFLLSVIGRTYKVAYPEKKKGGMHIAEHIEDVKNYHERYRVVPIDIHFNAGGGDGAEVWIGNAGTKKKQGQILASEILKEFKQVGQNSRGVKTTNDLYFINGCVGVPVLIECGFVDNKIDRKGFDTDKELKAYGQAIGKACVSYWRKFK